MLSSTGTVPARDINKPTATRQPTSEGGIGQGKVIVISPVHIIEAAIISLLKKPNWSEWCGTNLAYQRLPERETLASRPFKLVRLYTSKIDPECNAGTLTSLNVGEGCFDLVNVTARGCAAFGKRKKKMVANVN